MIAVDGHVGGVPIEETLLGLLPLGSALIAGAYLAANRLREASPPWIRRIRKERP